MNIAPNEVDKLVDFIDKNHCVQLWFNSCTRTATVLPVALGRIIKRPACCIMRVSEECYQVDESMGKTWITKAEKLTSARAATLALNWLSDFQDPDYTY